MPRAAVATSAARAAASRACGVLRSPLVRRRALAVRGSGRMSRAQAYRAALLKCFFGSGSRAQAPVRCAPVRASVVMRRLQRNQLDARGSGQPVPPPALLREVLVNLQRASSATSRGRPREA